MPDRYKTTLNLPQTDFPMKANLPQNEPKILQKWQSEGLYQKIRKHRKHAPPFILQDGPPYANGHIHIGHALNKILKAIVMKSRALIGYNTPYIPGWDCHGLPIELNVEKKLGKIGDTVSAEAFRQACRVYAEEYVQIQKEAFIRLGVLGDWDNPYRTMDSTYEAGIMQAVWTIAENGHLQKGYKPVHWCLECGSALAEAEVEYQDKTSASIDVAFLCQNPPFVWQKWGIQSNAPIAFAIWTTTPWTLPANQAIALHQEAHYVVLDTKPYALIVASDRVNTLQERYQQKAAVVLGAVSGNDLAGILCQHPLFDRWVPTLCADHVTLDSGTGAVHTAPAHGPDDFKVGIAANLPLDNPVDATGCYTVETPGLAGKHVRKVEPEILQMLKDKGLLLAHTPLQHSYPHCWRHKTPLIYRATPQWFISMDKAQLRLQTLEAIPTVTWTPDWGQARITGMIIDRPDWCISRQRAWGVPIPLFVHCNTGDIHPNMGEFIPTIVERVKKVGIEAWHQLNIHEFVSDPDYQKVTDTLDVWFESGVVHACLPQMRPEVYSPADLYLEGSDQHRGWFHSSLLTSMAMKQEPPYKAVLTHGYVVDAQGRKMSKSLGNVVDPLKVIQTAGADVLRLWVASTDYSMEVSVSDEILKRAGDAYRRIRNTARFLLANLHDFDPTQHSVPIEDMLALDAWVVGEAHRCQEIIQQAYETYQFHQIYQKIHNFCVVELGGFYLDIIKDRQYTTHKEGLPRRSAQTALYHVCEAFVRWIAPILSFTAEEIWHYLPNRPDSSVFLATWYPHLQPLSNTSPLTEADWQQVLNVRQAVNKGLEEARTSGAIGSGLEAEVVLYAPLKLFEILTKLGDELRFVLITSSATVQPSHDTELRFEITASQLPKCVRCWHHVEDVGQQVDYPHICGRCVTNLNDGEVRLYA